MGLLYRCTAKVQDKTTNAEAVEKKDELWRAELKRQGNLTVAEAFEHLVQAKLAGAKSSLVFFCRCGEGPLAANDTFVEVSAAKHLADMTNVRLEQAGFFHRHRHNHTDSGAKEWVSLAELARLEAGNRTLAANQANARKAEEERAAAKKAKRAEKAKKAEQLRQRQLRVMETALSARSTAA